MAKAEQITSLIRSHFENNNESFSTIALQLAAHEAKRGHNAVAQEIRSLVDKAKFTRVDSSPVQGELSELISISQPEERFSDLVLQRDLHERISRFQKEYHNKEKLYKYGLTNRRKILLVGPPGTGKTMTARVLAHELYLPLCTILMDKVMTKYMGESSAKLRQVFTTIDKNRGVYLFDEFDAIGSGRGMENDVGEMRRIVNSFLQFIEQDNSESIIIAATNNHKILDHALFRRFDDILYYSIPDFESIYRLVMNNLGEFTFSQGSIKNVLHEASNLSHAEIVQSCKDAIKEAILNGKKKVSQKVLKQMILERKSAYKDNLK